MGGFDSASLHLMPGSPTKFHTYSRRWLMLGAFFCVLAQNSSQWICLSPMVDTVARFYDCDKFWVYSSILVFDLLSPVSFSCGIFVSRFGCRRAIRLATIGTFVGGWLKVVWLSEFGQVVGQVIMALAHFMGAVSVPVFSALWFPTSERALSTSILFFATIVGGGVGFVLGPVTTQGDPNRLPTFLYLQAIIGSFLCVPSIFLQEKPPSPPSRSAEVSETHAHSHFSADVHRMTRNPQFLILLFGFALGFAILNTVAITANDVFTTFGYTNLEVGIIGCATVFSGMLGCVVLSILVDKTDCYKSALVITSACAGLFMLALYFNMRADNFETLSFCVFGAAFFGLSPFPVAYEMACEVLFPIHEAIASCVMTVIAQWLSIVMTAVEYWAIKDKAFVPLNAAILYIFVVIFFSFFRADLRRRQLDKCDAMSLASPPGRTGMGYGTSAGTGYGTDEQGPPWSPDKGTPAPEDF